MGRGVHMDVNRVRSSNSPTKRNFRKESSIVKDCKQSVSLGWDRHYIKVWNWGLISLSWGFLAGDPMARDITSATPIIALSPKCGMTKHPQLLHRCQRQTTTAAASIITQCHHDTSQAAIGAIHAQGRIHTSSSCPYACRPTTCILNLYARHLPVR